MSYHGKQVRSQTSSGKSTGSIYRNLPVWYRSHGSSQRRIHTLQLIGEFRNVLVCDLTRMCIRLNRIILSRKSKCIESDGEQYIVSLHSSLSGKYLDTGICLNMSNVHSRTTWVWELYKASSNFGLSTSVNSFKCLLLFPLFLPFRLDFLKIVFH